MKKRIVFLSIAYFLFHFALAQDLKVADVITFSNAVPLSNPTALFTGANLSNAANYAKIGVKFRIQAIDVAAGTATILALDFTPLPTAKEVNKRIMAAASATVANQAAADVAATNAAQAAANAVAAAVVPYVPAPAVGRVAAPPVPIVIPEPFDSDKYNNILYTVSITNLQAFGKLVVNEDRLSIGLLTLPFKARPQGDVSFDTEFNLNLTLNIFVKTILGSSLNIQLGAGIGSVGLNTGNASGLGTDEAQDVAVMTGVAGAMFQYKRVQVGVYSGVDYINNQRNYNWESNGNLWVGFGVGFDLFNITAAPPKSNSN